MTKFGKLLDEREGRLTKVLKYLIYSDGPVDLMKELGPGITSYHRMLLRLILLFTILFITHLPVLYIFSMYDFYGPSVGLIIKRSIGNMGFSRTQCDSNLL